MSLLSLKIHFALDHLGQLTTIEDVELNGLKCKCSCIGCGQPLAARLGKINRAHFAHHHVTSNCNHSAETDLHLAAKEYVRSHKRLSCSTGLFCWGCIEFPNRVHGCRLLNTHTPLKRDTRLVRPHLYRRESVSRNRSYSLL